MPTKRNRAPKVEYLTPDDVAVMYNVDSKTIRRWIKAGRLPAVVLPGGSKGRLYKIRKQDAENLAVPVEPVEAAE